MQRSTVPTVLATAALAAAAPLAAQSRVSSDVDRTVVTVGDRVELEVTVEHSSDAVVVWPDSLDAGPFEVLDVRIAPMGVEGGRATSSATFSMAAFELGELEIPSFEVSLLHADGGEETLETERFGVEVVSVGVDETGDIREIRGPLGIPISLLRVLLWVLIAALLGAALYALVRRLRKGEEGPVGRAAPPRLPPHEVALRELDRLGTSPLLERGQVKEYHIRVSEIIRRYLEDRFHVPALEMTTWEVLDGLESAGVEAGLRNDLKRFLDQCDLVKFAKARPGDDASRAVLALGREIVERTKPRAGWSAEAAASAPSGASRPAPPTTAAEATIAAEEPSGRGPGGEAP